MNTQGTVIAPTSNEIVSDQVDPLGSYVEALFDGARVMMHVVDRDFKIVKVNRRWLRVMEYDEAEVLGHGPAEFMTEESPPPSHYGRNTLLHSRRIGPRHRCGFL